MALQIDKPNPKKIPMPEAYVRISTITDEIVLQTTADNELKRCRVINVVFSTFFNAEAAADPATESASQDIFKYICSDLNEILKNPPPDVIGIIDDIMSEDILKESGKTMKVVIYDHIKTLDSFSGALDV